MSLKGEISCYMFCLIGPFNLNPPENSHWKRLEFFTSLGEKYYIYMLKSYLPAKKTISQGDM